MSSSHQSCLVSTGMLHCIKHVHSDALVVRPRIESNSLIKKRRALINLTQLSQFSISPQGVAVDVIKFQSLGVVARNLEAAHADRLAAEGVQLGLIHHAN